METKNIFILIGCIIAIYIIGKLFSFPISKILKLLINSFLGGLLIYIINIIGTDFNFHIGLNFVTSVFVGLLGIPGATLLVILKLIAL